MAGIVRVNTVVWDLLIKEAEARKTKASRLVDLFLRRGLGLEPKEVKGRKVKRTVVEKGV